MISSTFYRLSNGSTTDKLLFFNFIDDLADKVAVSLNLRYTQRLKVKTVKVSLNNFKSSKIKTCVEYIRLVSYMIPCFYLFFMLKEVLRKY